MLNFYYCNQVLLAQLYYGCLFSRWKTVINTLKPFSYFFSCISHFFQFSPFLTLFLKYLSSFLILCMCVGVIDDHEGLYPWILKTFKSYVNEVVGSLYRTDICSRNQIWVLRIRNICLLLIHLSCSIQYCTLA